MQVGDRLDVYWDTFRDFLNTGRVAIQDSYVVRHAPQGAGKLLRVIVEAGGDISVPAAAERLDTTSTVVFNYARELRLFAALTVEPNRLVLEPEVQAATDREEAIRARVLEALRKHKMYTLALRLMAQADDVGVLSGHGEIAVKAPVSIGAFAEALPAEFPTVEAKADSWFTYARSFAQWLEYAGVVQLSPDGMIRRPESQPPRQVSLLSGSLPVRMRSAFPGANPGPALQLLKHLALPAVYERPSRNGFRTAVRDLSLLGVLEMDSRERIRLADSELVGNGEINRQRLRFLVEQQRGMAEAFATLERDPARPPKTLGEAHRNSLGADWAESTTLSVGKYIRAWARASGVPTELRRNCSAGPQTLFDSDH